MLHTAFLHQLRKHELIHVLRFFPKQESNGKRRKVLEIGAGTGYQSKYLTRLGFDVTAIDIKSSAYRNERVFPVLEYDGCSIPMATGTFDIVFSSNVLEHVAKIDDFLDELRRVMSPDGYAIHVLPTPAWRFWTYITHYIWVTKRLWVLFARKKNDTVRSPQIPKSPRDIAGTLFPMRHGERGSSITELFYFSKRWWLKQFSGHGYKNVANQPTGIFYTGSFALGASLSIQRRRKLARILGSACRTYVFMKKESDIA